MAITSFARMNQVVVWHKVRTVSLAYEIKITTCEAWLPMGTICFAFSLSSAMLVAMLHAWATRLCSMVGDEAGEDESRE